MITQEELGRLISDLESDRVERTTSQNNTDKFSEAICAFANDFPNNKLPGYLIVGVKDNGEISGIDVTDQLLKDLASIRHNGQILPQPALTIEKFVFEKGEIAVVEVLPSHYPPVRYKGAVWIRTGPTKAKANETEERKLIEKRVSHAKTFDARPCLEAELNDLSELSFRQTYLPNAIDRETLQTNHREIKQQLASLRLFDLKSDKPTNAGILLLGINTRYFLPGAYIQYVKFSGVTLSSGVENEKDFSGALVDLLKIIDDFIKNNIVIQKPIRTDGFAETIRYNYPPWALRELIMNAIIHRDYESNAPIYFYEFSDRIEIVNPGGLYGDVSINNFPNASDYRNPVIAEAVKTMGYVNRFNYGIQNAQMELAKNGNQPAEFDLSLSTKFRVTIFKQQHENDSIL